MVIEENNLFKNGYLWLVRYGKYKIVLRLKIVINLFIWKC